jgi:hypothetical protein
VQHLTPQGHLVLMRGEVTGRARDLLQRGAVAVLNVIELPGNMRMRDLGCGGPCLNLGGEDGRFLENVMDRAAAASTADRLRVRLTLRSEQRSGLRAANVLGIIPGRSDETIIVNAHADGWFDGANDNGDGLAVMLALARHFARPEQRRQRTLVFVSSAGHHSSGLSGPGNLVALNPDLVGRNVFTINLEHVAALQLQQGRSLSPSGQRDMVTDSGEGFLMNGITPRSPLGERIVREGGLRYGVNFVSEASTYAAGDNPRVPGRLLQLIQTNPLYHSSGETIDVISTPGLERVARFTAHFVKEIDRLPASQLKP